MTVNSDDPLTPPEWTVTKGDALTLLREIPDASYDAVITDPPYSSGGLHRTDRNVSARTKYLTTGAASKERLPDFEGDNRSERPLLAWASIWLAEAYRVTKPGGAVAFFTDWRVYPAMSDAMQVAGWTWRGNGVWKKPCGVSRPTLGGLWNDTELILWGTRGANASTECLPGHWECAAPPSRTRSHVTEKPQHILQDLVRFAPPGGRILDPFAGSGSTGIAALSQGLSADLIEITSAYADIATARLEQFDQSGADTHRVGAQPSIFDATTA